MRAVLNRPDGALNKVCGVLGSSCGLGSKVSYLVCNYREALTCLAGSCSLDSSVERQNVGLECDILDSIDYIADLCGGIADLLHSAEHFLHAVVGEFSLLADLCHAVACSLGVASILGDLIGYLFNGSCQLLN